MSQWRMSMTFRPSVGFQGTTGSLYGWSESWYFLVDSTSAQILAAGLALVTARRQLLSPGWRVDRMRFSVHPGTRIAFAPRIAPAAGVGLYPLGPQVGDEQPYDRLINAAVCVSGRGKSYDLGGIASDVVDSGGTYRAPAPWVGRYNQWDAALSAGWAVRRRARNVTRIVSLVQTSGAATPPGWVPSPVRPVVSVPDDGGGAVAGETVRISSVRGMFPVNGTWTVQDHLVVNTTRWLLLAQKRGVEVIGTYAGGGLIWNYALSLDGYLSGTPARGGSRRTGGPSDRPRGRRSTRRS